MMKHRLPRIHVLFSFSLSSACLSGIATLACPEPVSSQVHEIGGSPTCTRCEIVIEPGVLLGAVTDSTSPAAQFVISADSRRRLYVAPLADRAGVGVYDGTTGDYLTRIGRRGKGPGDFAYAQEVKVGPGDTLVVMDGLLSRYTIFSPSLELIDVINLPFPDQGAVLFNSRDLVIHANVNTPDLFGFLLHRVVDGKIVRSFAEAETVLPGRHGDDGRRRLARASGGGVWVARTDSYHIELWDTTGVRRRQLIGDRPWLTGSSGPEGQGSVNGIWEDESGLLFVLMDVVDEAWQDRPPPDLDMRSNFRVQQDRYMHTIIEVLDPSNGRLLASLKSDELLNGGSLVDSPGLVESRSEDDLGWLRILAHRVRLVSH